MYFHNHFTVCFSVCCLLAGLHKYQWLELHDKYHKMGLGPTLITLMFEIDLEHHLDTK